MTTETLKPAKSAVSKPAPAATAVTAPPVASHLELPRYESAVFVVLHEPAHGVTIADLQRPSYWKLLTRQLGRSKWIEIRAIAKDGSFEAQLRVEQVLEDGVHVRVLSTWTNPEKPARLPEGYAVALVSDGWKVAVPPGEEPIGVIFVTEYLAAKAAIQHEQREPV